MPPALRIESLWKCYVAGVRGCSARAWVLRDLSVHVETGERVAIVGGAGAGKSTLAACILGLRRADLGRIEVSDAVEIFDVPDVVTCVRSDVTPVRGELAGSLLASPHPHLPISTVLYLTRDAASVPRWVERVLLLRDGRLHDTAFEPVRRVAERAIR